LTLAFVSDAGAADLTAGMKVGQIQLESIGPLAFGPEGILFVADPKAATIYAIATDDPAPDKAPAEWKVADVQKKLAAALGTAADQVLVVDVAVHPKTFAAFVSLTRGRGPDAAPVLASIQADGKIQVFPLVEPKHSMARLPNPPKDGQSKDQRGGNPRLESITDIAYLEDRVLVAGLSSEEFASTLRSIPFPFKSVDNGSSVEIYHGAHGRFETRSPVRTFVPFNIGGEPHLLAAYTCTPLVDIPLSQVKPNAKIRGTTIAELGNRNRPLDMIVYQKDGKDFLLMANSSRGVMKISTENLEKAESITSPVEGGGKKGQSYETIESLKGIEQLDRLDAKRALVLRREEGGSLVLEAIALP
jgi:hypothetical protein